MSQETNRVDHSVDQEVKIDSSPKADAPQEEKKYTFNQAEVNQDRSADEGGYVNHLHTEKMQEDQSHNAYSNNEQQQNNRIKKKGMFGFFTEEQKMPVIKTDEDARNAFYGINQPYYKEVYRKYKEGKKVNWNWCAFLFQGHWFFSRKMYAIGTLYTAMMSFIFVSMNQIMDNITNPTIQAMSLPWIVVFLGLWIATGMFANYAYMAHMENKIVYPSDKKLESTKIAQNVMIRGGFSVYGILLSLIVSDLFVSFVDYMTTILK